MPLLQEGDKAKLVDAALKLMEQELLATKEQRDRAAESRKGGGR
jgi:hypothetical protein